MPPGRTVAALMGYVRSEGHDHLFHAAIQPAWPAEALAKERRRRLVLAGDHRPAATVRPP
jgi:hypothetical protein